MPRVAVIGAGASGMKAAFELVRKKLDVVVYEASERVGGRVRTVDVGGEAVDLGAESFEAGEHSEWVRELQELKLFPPGVTLVDPFPDVDPALYWYPDGTLTRAALHEALLRPEARRVEQTFERNVESASDIAVGHGVDLAASVARVAYTTSGYSAFSESIDAGQYSAQDRSRNAGGADDLRPFGDGRPYGIGTLFCSYGRALAAQKGARLQLLARVVEMSQRVDCGWQIRTETDDIPETFDALIVTVPVSVLVQDDFPLPESIRRSLRAALTGIELGAYLKTAMHWPSAAKALGDKPFLGYYTSVDGLRTWQISKYERSEVVMVHTAGNSAIDSERAGVTAAAARAAAVVRLVTRDKGGPEAAATSTWQSSPFSRGAYSYSRVGAGHVRPRLHETVLAAHAPAGLFFAGEAFSVPLYGSLEATWHTGLAAAERCIDYLTRR